MTSDLIIDGGHIVTMDPARRLIDHGQILVRKGRIVAIGEDVSAQALPDARRIDASGHMVLPGLVNLHSHTAYSVLRGSGEDRGTASLYELLFPLMGLFTPVNVEAFSRVSMVEMLKSGATTVVESGTHADSVARVASELGIRCMISETVTDIDMEPDGVHWSVNRALGEETLGRAEDLVRNWHGVNDGRITAMVAPSGPDSCTDELLQQTRDLAEKHDLRLTIHVGGDKEQLAIVQARADGLTPMELLHRLGTTGPDLLAAHCVYLSERDRQIIAESGTSISHNPSINAKRGHVAPVRDLRDRGVAVGLGSDNMHSNMVEVMKVAVLLNRVRENDGTYPQPHDALAMATIEGARAIGRDHEIGSLEVGKLADIILVDLDQAHLQPTIDPGATFVHNGLASDIRTVLVGGEVVVQHGHVVGVDEHEVVEAAREHAPKVWRGLGL